MSESRPVGARVLLGRELKELREAAGLDHKQVASSIGWTLQKIYRSEQGIGSLKKEELDTLLRLYAADGPTAERVHDIGAQARRRGRYGNVPDWSRQYYGLEQEATELGFHQGELIPGLFQTEAYARALLETSKTTAPSDVDSAVAARLRRQDLLRRGNPPDIHLILGEAALHRLVGGPGTLAEQIDHLIELSRMRHVTIQVLPFAAGAHAAVGQGFTLLTLEIGGKSTNWVYVSDLTRGECRSEEPRVRTYRLIFSSLAVHALRESETLSLLEQCKGRLEL